MIILKKLHALSDAISITEELEKNGIQYNLRQEVFPDEGSLSDSTDRVGLLVEIDEADEEAGRKILEECEEITVDRLEKDYYLFEFTNEELEDILKKQDEWGLNDYYWAYDILQTRGNAPSLETIHFWRKARYEELAKPQAVTATYIRNSYIACILGGFIGIFMGRHLSHFQKLLPDGKKFPAFDEPSQKIGHKITIIGSIFLILWLTLIIYFSL